MPAVSLIIMDSKGTVASAALLGQEMVDMNAIMTHSMQEQKEGKKENNENTNNYKELKREKKKKLEKEDPNRREETLEVEKTTE